MGRGQATNILFRQGVINICWMMNKTSYFLKDIGKATQWAWRKRKARSVKNLMAATTENKSSRGKNKNRSQSLEMNRDIKMDTPLMKVSCGTFYFYLLFSHSFHRTFTKTQSGGEGENEWRYQGQIELLIDNALPNTCHT